MGFIGLEKEAFGDEDFDPGVWVRSALKLSHALHRAGTTVQFFSPAPISISGL